MSKIKRLEIEIYGDVQGVTFRHVAKTIAEKLDIKGWIRNEPDGSIRVVVQGERDRLEEFLNWCHHGSPMATVEKVESREGEEMEEFKEFEIR